MQPLSKKTVTSKIVKKINARCRPECSGANCTTRPSFGMDGQKARFCKDHKLDGMIDVAHARCEHASCTKRPKFGIDGQNARALKACGGRTKLVLRGEAAEVAKFKARLLSIKENV